MHMGIALQLLFTGLGVGSIYALVALGFVLIYRATNVGPNARCLSRVETFRERVGLEALGWPAANVGDRA